LGIGLFYSAVALGGVAIGLAAGRWWALLAAFLIPLAYIPAGTDSDGMPHWEIALYAITPVAFIGLAVGVGIRKVLASRSRPA
jgi:hypothetical protein